MCAKTFSRTHSQQADVSHEDQTDVEPQYTKEMRGDCFFFFKSMSLTGTTSLHQRNSLWRSCLGQGNTALTLLLQRHEETTDALSLQIREHLGNAATTARRSLLGFKDLCGLWAGPSNTYGAM